MWQDDAELAPPCPTGHALDMQFIQKRAQILGIRYESVRLDTRRLLADIAEWQTALLTLNPCIFFTHFELAPNLLLLPLRCCQHPRRMMSKLRRQLCDAQEMLRLLRRLLNGTACDAQDVCTKCQTRFPAGCPWAEGAHIRRSRTEVSRPCDDPCRNFHGRSEPSLVGT